MNEILASHGYISVAVVSIAVFILYMLTRSEMVLFAALFLVSATIYKVIDLMDTPKPFSYMMPENLRNTALNIGYVRYDASQPAYAFNKDGGAGAKTELSNCPSMDITGENDKVLVSPRMKKDEFSKPEVILCANNLMAAITDPKAFMAAKPNRDTWDK